MQDWPAHVMLSGVPSKLSLLRRAVIIFLVATLLGLFFAAQIYFSAASLHRDIGWGQSLYWALGDWYEWALLLPIIDWLCRKFPLDRESWLKTLPAYLGAGLSLAAIHAGLCALAAVFQGWFTSKPVTLSDTFRALLANRTPYNMVSFAVVVSAWHAWEYHRRFREREAEAAELAGRLAQAQLQTLRMQLNPHFLCNTLNAVSSLMLKDVTTANRMLSRLGNLLRMTLENTNQQEVPLEQELDLLHRYIELEQIRFGDRLQLKVDIDPATLEAAVPNFILQPLVENAIRHAIEPNETAGQLGLRAARDNGHLILQISDTGPGKKLEEKALAMLSNDRQEHIGLSNTRERLRKLYGEGEWLELSKNTYGGMTASLSIPFHLPSAAAFRA